MLLTAPASGDIKNIVYNVNDDTIGSDTIVSAASCTTNAITPTLKLLNDKYGIENGHMETIHAFTNDQNLVDNHHKAERRGRAATLNMVMTSTGAAKAVSKAIPELKGKLSGSSVRVPTPNVSLAILNLNFKTQSIQAMNSMPLSKKPVRANNGKRKLLIQIRMKPFLPTLSAVKKWRFGTPNLRLLKRTVR